MAITGGEGEIRTRETLSRPHAFQACAFNHSATSPSKNLLSNKKFAIQIHPEKERCCVASSFPLPRPTPLFPRQTTIQLLPLLFDACIFQILIIRKADFI